MIQILSVPFGLAPLLPSKARLDTNASLLPSDDHVGANTKAFAAVNLVRGVGCWTPELFNVVEIFD